MSFLKPLLSYPFFDFIKSYWQKKNFFYPGYHFIYPNINQSLKSWFDYVFLVKHKPVTKKKKRWRTY